MAEGGAENHAAWRPTLDPQSWPSQFGLGEEHQPPPPPAMLFVASTAPTEAPPVEAMLRRKLEAKKLERLRTQELSEGGGEQASPPGSEEQVGVDECDAVGGEEAKAEQSGGGRHRKEQEQHDFTVNSVHLKKVLKSLAPLDAADLQAVMKECMCRLMRSLGMSEDSISSHSLRIVSNTAPPPVPPPVPSLSSSHHHQHQPHLAGSGGGGVSGGVKGGCITEKGFGLLSKMGWSPGQGLGRTLSLSLCLP